MELFPLPVHPNLTAGRVVIAGASGLLTDSPNLTFSGDKLTVARIESPTAGLSLNFSGGSGLVFDSVGFFDGAGGNYSLGKSGKFWTGLFLAGDITFASGNMTGVGNITGVAIDISAGTGIYSSSGTMAVGNTTVSGFVLIDDDNIEALLVRKDGDAGDIFTVDTTNSRVGVNVSSFTPDTSVQLDAIDGISGDIVGKSIRSMAGAGFAQAGGAGGGGQFAYLSGIGGDATDSSGAAGGAGGAFGFVAGAGGGATAGSGTVASGGAGGEIQLITGAGGAIAFSSGSITGTGGAGGMIIATAANGGSAFFGTSKFGGAGGGISLSTGNGGDVITDGIAGDGGDITFDTGAGGVGNGGADGTDGNIIFKIDGTTAVTIDENLNVGIGTTAAVSLLEVDGAMGLAILTVTGNTTLDKTHSTVLVNASGNVVISLPTAASAFNSTDGIGRIYRVKKIDNDADTVTLDGNGSETIDGGITAILTVQYETITIQSDGSNWHIL